MALSTGQQRVFFLRGGYVYDNNPVLEKTLDPRLPDSDQHNVCIGVGYKRSRFTIDAAYLAAFYEDREVNNDVFKGEYESFAHFVILSIGYVF
ncbi:MAG: hypothetical protein E3K32_03480 [wastewater metagenome]|nr:hypothetical protein [Candidatus Loosdrechtia aerotolerans]